MNDSYEAFEYVWDGKSIEISKEDFDEAVEARKVLVCLMDMESLFGVVARAYIDLEKSLLSASVEWSLEGALMSDRIGFFDKSREEINLKTLALLSSAGIFQERMDRLAKKGAVTGFDWAEFAPQRSIFFDSSFSFRVMCALRNFAIHDSLPISNFTVSSAVETESGRMTEGAPWRKRLTSNPVIKTEPLTSSTKIRAATRDEILGRGMEALDLKMLVREYIQILHNIRSLFHSQTECSLQRAIKHLAKLKNQLELANNKPCSETYIGRVGDEFEEAIYIEPNRLSRVLEARDKWKILGGVRRFYISSEALAAEGVWSGDLDDLYIKQR
ncbi:MAG: hypothetical protein VX248_17890 [Pseudomonadota bacterium]|nr:hypothetical protein [Pseudomonadota bacterium]